MATEAKRASNARYLAKYKGISVRIPLDELPRVQQAADAAGQSLAGYIIEAMRKRMDAEKMDK